MKKFLFILMLFFSVAGLYANDTYFFMSSGQLVPTQESDIEVEMQEEIINIKLEHNYYEVTVDFFFYNPGPEVELEIGFPFFCVGIDGNGTISDFKCWTNDVETSFTDYPFEKKWANDTELENAFVRKITFPSKKITKTKISYKSTYGRSAPSYLIAKYLYGTGSSWKNAIGKMTVRIQNNDLYYSPRFVRLPGSSEIKRINDNTWEAVITNIEPEKYTDSITIETGNIWGDDGPRVLRKERYFGCRSRLTQQNLFWYTSSQLRLIRNAIFAFHGYPFKSEDLIDLFINDIFDMRWFGKNDNGKSNYPLDENFSKSKLSDIEKDNINLLLEEENKLKKMK